MCTSSFWCWLPHKLSRRSDLRYFRMLRFQGTVFSGGGVEARPLRRLEISFSQGAEWKALISKYIGAIPLSGDAAEQSISGGPPAGTAVSNAMMAKVGAAPRHNQSAAPCAVARPLL